jgi:hypothetical protein
VVFCDRAIAAYLDALDKLGWTRTYGAWVEGHHDPDDVVGAVAADFGRKVGRRSVQRGWVRTLRGVMHFTNARGRGAKPCMWVEW